ncbi:MAG: Trk system potassium transporter TrkA [Sphaerochaetaceae bacterium]|nr:Trk system potassium transporter TrkA [Spirochaetales bacterium]MDY5499864.1 Trk system potassium transporter TrkA [Sphaerochaetaceae bacterium]
MLVVILGAGHRGLHLAKLLIGEKKDITFIDSDPEQCDLVAQKLDCMAVNGSGTDPQVLDEAGCRNADIFIAITNSDEVNLVSCALVSSKFKTPRTIAVIRSMSYTGSEMNVPLLGVDIIVNPSEEVSKQVYDIIMNGLYQGAMTFPHTPFILCNLSISYASPLRDMPLSKVRPLIKTPFVLAAIQRGRQTLLPSGSTVLQKGDTLALITFKEQMTEMLGEFDASISSPRHICLVGAGRISRYLLSKFSPSRRKWITVVDIDEAKCEQFSEMYPETLVIKGDITDQSVWDDESLDDYDLMVAITDKDELNIIISAYAKRMGIAHTIALVKTNPNYAMLARHLDIDTVISSTESTVDSLLRYIRGENITSIHSIFGGSIEVAEYKLTATNKLLGQKLKDVPLAGKVIITGVTDKDKNSILANGNYTFTEGDTILVAVPHGRVDYATRLFS